MRQVLSCKRLVARTTRISTRALEETMQRQGIETGGGHEDDKTNCPARKAERSWHRNKACAARSACKREDNAEETEITSWIQAIRLNWKSLSKLFLHQGTTLALS